MKKQRICRSNVIPALSLIGCVLLSACKVSGGQLHVRVEPHGGRSSFRSRRIPQIDPQASVAVRAASRRARGARTGRAALANTYVLQLGAGIDPLAAAVALVETILALVVVSIRKRGATESVPCVVAMVGGARIGERERESACEICG